MPLIRRLAVFLLALLLTACAAPKLTAEQAAAIKSVGIVSLLPQEVKYRKIGITVFNNEHKTLPAGDAFNAAARASAAGYLRASGKYQVKQIEVADAPAMAARLHRRSLVMSQDIERIDAELVTLAQANGVDAVLLIAENFDPERGIFGLAMSMRAGFGDVRSAAAVAGVQVAGITARKEIFLGRYPSPGMGVRVLRPDNKPWSYQLEENLDEATHQRVVKALQGAIENAVASALGSSDL